jgi:hypothetical protein
MSMLLTHTKPRQITPHTPQPSIGTAIAAMTILYYGSLSAALTAAKNDAAALKGKR